MKMIILLALQCCVFQLPAQSPIKIQTLVEGGKTLVDLVKIIKLPGNKTRDCQVKQFADICFRNKTPDRIRVAMDRKNDSIYSNQPLEIIAVAAGEECLYELRSGVYKYEVYLFFGGASPEVLLRSGELKLLTCEKSMVEIAVDEKRK